MHISALQYICFEKIYAENVGVIYSKNVVKMAQLYRVTVLKTHTLIPHRAPSNCAMKVLFYQILSSSYRNIYLIMTLMVLNTIVIDKITCFVKIFCCLRRQKIVKRNYFYFTLYINTIPIKRLIWAFPFQWEYISNVSSILATRTVKNKSAQTSFCSK